MDVIFSRREAIKKYFHDGYTNKEICSLLRVHHDMCVSASTVKRVLKSLGLKRRGILPDQNAILVAVQTELEGSGRCLGYRSMTARLKNVYGLTVPRHYVMQLMRMMNPEGVADRQIHRFTRRTYYSKGPNYLIHLDGYDKLKPFGFAIHGCIDGFSRRILWLKVARTNNDPLVIGYYFMEFVESIEGVPRCIRMDRGTENVFVEILQKSMRWDHSDDMAGDNSYIYGSSHRNERIERWWLTLRQSCIDFYINMFKDLEHQGIFSTDDNVHRECMRFSFTEVIQSELDRVASEWNAHRVRGRGDMYSIHGKPDFLYFTPEEYDAVDYKTTIGTSDIRALRDMCSKPRSSGCEEDFERVCIRLQDQHGRQKPTNAKEALDTFAWLVTLMT